MNGDGQIIIVRVTTFYRRTVVYIERREMNGISVQLDLPRKGYGLLKEPRKCVDKKVM